MLEARRNGAVELYYDNSQKLATTNTGIDVTGTVTADGLTVDGNATLQANTSSEAPVLTLRNDGDKQAAIVLDADRSTGNGSLGQIRGNWNGTTVTRMLMSAGSDTTNKDDGRIYLQTAPDGALKNRFLIDNNGDISFYEDTGTTPKFFWDASTERLGIGTTSPDTLLSIEGSGRFYGSELTGDADYDGSNNHNGIRVGSSSSYWWQISRENVSSGHLSFIVKSNNTPDEKMRIDTDGKVGIGTASPSSKLQVNGTVTATSFSHCQKEQLLKDLEVLKMGIFGTILTRT